MTSEQAEEYYAMIERLRDEMREDGIDVQNS